MNQIKYLRNYLKMSQTEFAEKIGISQQTLSGIENNSRTLTDHTVITICSVFGVSEEWLRTGDGDMFPVSPEDDALIEAFALIGADDLDPRRKRLAKEIIDMILSMPDDSLSVLQAFFQNAANALASSASANEEKEKDED